MIPTTSKISLLDPAEPSQKRISRKKQIKTRNPGAVMTKMAVYHYQPSKRNWPTIGLERETQSANIVKTSWKYLLRHLARRNSTRS